MAAPNFDPIVTFVDYQPLIEALLSIAVMLAGLYVLQTTLNMMLDAIQGIESQSVEDFGEEEYQQYLNERYGYEHHD